MEIPEPTNFVLAVMGATLFGLLSVPHCLGMCGPLHLAVCLSGGKRSFRALSVFNLGRIAGYTAIGVLCGLFGGQLSDFFTHKPAHAPVVAGGHSGMNGTSAQEGVVAKEAGSVAVPKSCCEVDGQAVEKVKDQRDQEDGEEGEGVVQGRHETEGRRGVEAKHAQDAAVAAGTGDGGAAGPHGKKKPMWRRALMLLFPAAILLLSGLKALRRKPAVVGEGSQGIFASFFNRARKAGPAACGAAASLIPCGMLYYAFAIAVSTLSAILGATFLFVYCFTISFFMQLSIMVGTTFGRKLGPKVDRAFPWLAFTGAAVYVTLFFVK